MTDCAKVYSILSKELEASYTCWTSNMRGLHNNLPSFSGNEKTHSDFTISERDTASRFTQWLEGKGISQAKDWLNRDMTYHLEVKTTTGKLLDPFMMSNNQMRLVRLQSRTWNAPSLLLDLADRRPGPRMA